LSPHYILTYLKSSVFAALTRSAFFARRRMYDQPNWVGVGLAFTTSAALWAFVSQDVISHEKI
uniref:Uncharacterized protein n=1 Tax=Meleagris gallopavo TaxID=9103 RepID=A0A803Y2N5_MELGA